VGRLRRKDFRYDSGARGRSTSLYRDGYRIPDIRKRRTSISAAKASRTTTTSRQLRGAVPPNEDVDIIASTDSAGGGYVVNDFETASG